MTVITFFITKQYIEFGLRKFGIASGSATLRMRNTIPALFPPCLPMAATTSGSDGITPEA